MKKKKTPDLLIKVQYLYPQSLFYIMISMNLLITGEMHSRVELLFFCRWVLSGSVVQHLFQSKILRQTLLVLYRRRRLVHWSGRLARGPSFMLTRITETVCLINKPQTSCGVFPDFLTDLHNYNIWLHIELDRGNDYLYGLGGKSSDH